MNEESRLTFLATNYGNLQSLRFALVYVWLIVDQWLDYHRIGVSLAIAWGGLCVAWFFFLGAYYKRRYGRVESDPAAVRKTGFWKNRANLVSLLYPVTVIAFICALVANRSQHPRGTAISCFLVATVPLGWGMTPSNIWLRRSYYIGANASAILIALAATSRHMPGYLFLSAYGGTFLAVILLVLGIMDHLVLRRTFLQGPQPIYV